MRLNSTDRSLKYVPPRLKVHVWTPGGFLLAGRLELDESGDRNVSATFQYDTAYLEEPDSFALDPINMPLSQRRFGSTSSTVVLGAIFDAAPDAWGRRVAQARLPMDQQHMMYRGAMLRGADGIGALLMTPDEHKTQEDLQAIVNISLAERPAVSQIASAAAAARQLETTGEVQAGLEGMLAGSWTIGGARPKAILRDDREGAIPGSSLIAKFSTSGDNLERVRMEYATMRMAKAVGLAVPKHELLQVQTDFGLEPTLLIERFDRDYDFDQIAPKRRHYLSAISLVSATPQTKFLDSRFDVATFSWSRLLEVSARVSKKPSAAKVEMFARLCFNAAIGNTDDHLKNFGFLKVDNDPVHYEIAPVFDVSPQPSMGHYLHCANLGRHYTLDQALAQARTMGISSTVAQDVRSRILDVFSRANDFFEEAGMSALAKKSAGQWISRNLPDINDTETTVSIDQVREKPSH
jgi:serine/threonine-protein kinase HipA